MKLIISIFILGSVLALPSMVKAAGLEIEPALIKFQSIREDKAEVRIKNPTTVSQNFELYTDSHSKTISLAPAKFTLLPGQEKIVTVTVSRANNPKKIKTNISIVAYPSIQTGFAAAAGVKIPVSAKGANPIFPRDSIEWMIYAATFLGSLFLLSLHPDIKNKYTIRKTVAP